MWIKLNDGSPLNMNLVETFGVVDRRIEYYMTNGAPCVEIFNTKEEAEERYEELLELLTERSEHDLLSVIVDYLESIDHHLRSGGW